MRLRSLISTLALLASPVLAAGAIDLGEGLGYLRVPDATQAAVEPVSGPLVLDLRRTTAATIDEASRLGPLITSPGPVRFVLISKETAGPVRDLLANRAATVLTLGAGETEPAPDIAVAISAEDDLRAHAALDEGTALEVLIRPNVTKPRRDEAAIVRSRVNGGMVPPEDPAPPADPAAAETAPAPLVDVVLQQAVLLHRGLKALGRL